MAESIKEEFKGSFLHTQLGVTEGERKMLQVSIYCKQLKK